VLNDSVSRENNFDLIRLISALQVVVWHSHEHLSLSSGFLIKIISIIKFFPGVPIFFVISGFLIYSSYKRNKSFEKYLKNRMLRIFPALWFVFCFTLGVLFIIGIIKPIDFFSKEILIWCVTQVTIFQFYTPEILRSFGVGTPNGSLWTIFIEFSFYLFIPVLFFLLQKKNKPVLIMGFFILISFLYNYWYRISYLDGSEHSIIIKLLGLNLLPYLFYFLMGSLVSELWDKVKHYYIGKGMYWLIVYVIYCFIMSLYLQEFQPSYWPNIYGLVSILILAQTVISLAYTNGALSNKILKRNDISYGVYLFHMPIINIVLFLGYEGSIYAFLNVFVLTILMAYISWRLIEEPSLRLKNRKLI
jgi:peptidoglycan/LPS O-acetylase OafA/YrhL